MISSSRIKEDLLQYIWKTKRFDFSNLSTTQGLKIEILQFGFINHGAGPDFSDSRILIDGIEWAGHVEMHVRSSMWYEHGHQNDLVYNGVILHVVYEHDKEVRRKDGSIIPVLEMKNLIDKDLENKYHVLISNEAWIPCANVFPNIDPFHWKLWMNKLMVERLERKTNDIQMVLESNDQDWEQLIFLMLFKYLGSQTNALPMELLAAGIDVNVLYKLNDLFSIEALLFGQAGFLSGDLNDDYGLKLKSEYDFLKTKLGLKPLDRFLWKFGRLRPANFPTVRIAQLASLFSNQSNFFRKVVEAKSPVEIRAFFNCEPSVYWKEHYVFDKKSTLKVKKIGSSFIDLICINVVAPVLFEYGKSIGEEKYKTKALLLLEALKPENNQITRGWKSLGLKAMSAEHSQAMIQLKKEYCDKVRCMHCSIGHEILKS